MPAPEDTRKPTTPDEPKKPDKQPESKPATSSWMPPVLKKDEGSKKLATSSKDVRPPPAPKASQLATPAKPAGPAAPDKPTTPSPEPKQAQPAPPAKPSQPSAPDKAAKPAPQPKEAKPATTQPKPAAAKPAEPAPAAVDSATVPREMLEKLIDLLRKLGQVINNAALYGPAHKITSRSMHDCFAALVKLLENWPRINLSLVEGDLLVEGKPAGLRNPFVNILAGKLADLGVSGFSLLKGMSKEEFYNLMELLVTAKATEGAAFADAVAQRNLQHVHAERVKYARVTEGAVVVDKGEAQAAEAAAAAGVAIEQIMAFLKGDVGVKPEQVADDLHKVSSDADQLAGLIMEAAAVRQKGGDLQSGESLADIAVGCLRRTFTGLTSDPSAKTITGKKALKKTLLVLEKTVLDKLHAIGGQDPEADEAIDAAVEEMIDELEIDQLTAEYAKRRKALEKTESRVMRYIKAHEGQEDIEVNLQEKLAEAGVTPNGWQELVVKTRKEAQVGGRGLDQGMAGAGVLAVLLSELDDMMAGMPDPRALGQKVAQLGEKVGQLADGTEQKIDQLDEKMREEEGATVGVEEAEKSKIKLSRKALMELLAEIVQELCQSLSAINCAVGMTLAGHIGDLNDEQREVLGVAANCARRLDQLLDRLFEIVGLPTSLTPKKEIVYSRPPT